MKELIAMLKKAFELSVKVRWLKGLEKEIDKGIRLDEKARLQHCIVNDLVKEYKERFGEDMRKEGK